MKRNDKNQKKNRRSQRRNKVGWSSLSYWSIDLHQIIHIQNIDFSSTSENDLKNYEKL